MNYNKNLHIQFKYTCMDSICDQLFVYWRVIPRELPLLKRIFCNPWRKVLIVRNNEQTYSRLLYHNEYIKYIYPLHTVGEMIAYETEMELNLVKNRALYKLKKNNI